MMGRQVLDELGIEGLRAVFLRFTREAYGALPPFDRPRILDVGCGAGLPTLELARLSGGDVVAVDPEHEAIEILRSKIAAGNLSDHVQTMCCSIFDAELAPSSFDIVWEEGVFHLLATHRVLDASARLLKPGGFLVMFETDVWLEGAAGAFPDHGFTLFHRVRLPPGIWWDAYYAPLEARLAKLRSRGTDPGDREVLLGLEREVAAVKADVTKTDCSFFIVRRTS